MLSNLPPGCTDRDIDRAYGGDWVTGTWECCECGAAIVEACVIDSQSQNTRYGRWWQGTYHATCEVCGEEQEWTEEYDDFQEPDDYDYDYYD